MKRATPAGKVTGKATGNVAGKSAAKAAGKSSAKSTAKSAVESARRAAGKIAGNGGADWLLAVDIGNTQTVLGVLEGDAVRDLFRLTSYLPRTGDELLPTVGALIAPYRSELEAGGRMAIGSVVPPLTQAWEALSRRLLGRDAFVVSAQNALGIEIDLREPEQLGADRIANAVAVAALYRLPAIVVDLGTATTFDVVLPGPHYIGGVIAPGLHTAADELFRRAARLTRVEIRRPEAVCGRSTEASVRSGVYFGAVGQIDGIVWRLCRELSIDPLIIATGGLAETVAVDSETITAVDAALTLHGLRILERRARG